MHKGKIASGDEDIIDPLEAASLNTRTGAIAVAWEGAGAARAARFAKVPFLEIRAITDVCSENSLSDFKANIGPVMLSLSKALLPLLKAPAQE